MYNLLVQDNSNSNYVTCKSQELKLSITKIFQKGNITYYGKTE